MAVAALDQRRLPADPEEGYNFPLLKPDAAFLSCQPHTSRR